MKDSVVSALVAAGLLVGSIAAAQTPPAQPAPGAVTASKEVVGTIKSLDPQKVVMQDGTELMIPATLTVNPMELKEGVKVKVSYREQEGRRIVTAIERQPN